MATRNEEAAPGQIAPGTVIDGRYQVVRALGQGGNGLVNEVIHLRTGRHLALKSLLDESGMARLEQEARASALMKNGHMAKITDMGTNGPAGPYLVMELLEGQSLRDLLDEAGQLPLELTINIALQACECLAEAHGLGIVHRDLKPDNIFLCASPWPGQYDVKVLDFGIVKIAIEGPIPQSSLTRTGSTVGTPYYMSLEQLRNSSAVDARADIYSLGVVLYECLCGRKPFLADTIGDLVYALCSGPPTHLHRLRPDLPADVCEVIMRTLSTNRDERPATMSDLANALLAHGNSAFGLWIRNAGRTPTPGAVSDAWSSLGGALPSAALGAPGVPIMPSPLVAPPGATAPMPARPHIGTPLPAAGRPARPASPASPAINAGRTAPLPPVALAPLTPSAITATPLPQPSLESTPQPSDHAARAPDDRALMQGNEPTTEPRVKPARPASLLDPNRRDTPTEMYIKEPSPGLHDVAGEPTASDRDTPTKSFPELLIAAANSPRDRPFVETLRSRQGPDDLPDARASEPPASTVQGSPFDVSAPFPGSVAHASSTSWSPPQVQSTRPPTLAPRGPSGLFGSGGSMPDLTDGDAQDSEAGTIARGSVVNDPRMTTAPIPQWQASLDRALTTVGDLLENLARRFRMAPQKIQIAIAAGAGALVLLIVCLLITALTRR